MIDKYFKNMAYRLCDFLELFSMSLAVRWGFFIMNLYLNKHIRKFNQSYQQPTLRVIT